VSVEVEICSMGVEAGVGVSTGKDILYVPPRQDQVTGKSRNRISDRWNLLITPLPDKIYMGRASILSAQLRHCV
jgi:hypothetical protein